MEEKRLTEHQFIDVYSYIIVNRIPFQYKYDGVSQTCYGKTPEVILKPNHSRNEFFVEAEPELISKILNPDFL